jgi:hypothetical protein
LQYAPTGTRSQLLYSAKNGPILPIAALTWRRYLIDLVPVPEEDQCGDPAIPYCEADTALRVLILTIFKIPAFHAPAAQAPGPASGSIRRRAPEFHQHCPGQESTSF